MSWDVYSSSETTKAAKVSSISAFSWGSSARSDDSGRVYALPTTSQAAVPQVMPTGVGVGAGAGAIGFGATAIGSGVGTYIATRQNQQVAPTTPYQSAQIVPGDSAYGVPFSGPGLKEPGGQYLLKEWHQRIDSPDGDYDLQYYLTVNGRGQKRVFMYSQRTKAWKTWPIRPNAIAYISKKLPNHRMLTRLRRNLKRHQADAVTILKLVSPNKLESTRRPGGRFVRGKKRYID